MSGSLLRRVAPVLALLVVATTAMLVGLRMGAGRRPPQKPGYLRFAVVGVGHGEASWVRTPNGRFIVIGGGPPEQGARVVQSLRAAGAQRIELLILPYPYAEAIGGAEDVLAAFPVSMALEPGGARVNEWQDNCRRFLRQNRVPVKLARAGQSLTLDGVQIDILAPGMPFTAAEPVSANNSVVAALRWGETRLLFAGGLERGGEVALLARTPDLSAEWLRVAHFASRQATSSELLRQVAPRIAVVSVGENNDGLPHPETLSRLRATGATVLRTDEADGGDLFFLSDGATVWRETSE